jgi:hypothetical protein
LTNILQSTTSHSSKDPYSPHTGNFCRPEGRGEKIVSDNSKCIRTSKGGRGLTSYFLRGGGMDVFWNDSITKIRVYKKSVYFMNVLINIDCLGTYNVEQTKKLLSNHYKKINFPEKVGGGGGGGGGEVLA